ncbi:MAG: aminotransferase class I/II-fold pyridoxal phosphate-dependent enzyme [Phycisphaerae bacterium]|nr:aminotransferase class I/II-fold pyridoxal phosphate-dependent enzyme [Phycisphaerae bacterium]
MPTADASIVPFRSRLLPDAEYADATIAVHAGNDPDPVTGSIVQPIVQSTSFAQRGVGDSPEFAYSRVSNPTVSALERALGALEGSPQAVAFSSGLSATTSLFLALLKPGDEVLISDVVYGGTTRLLQQILAPLGVTSRWIDTSDSSAVSRAITDQTRLVFVESPANPTLKLTDIGEVARITRARGVTLVVDNTFLTAVIQRPLDLGADITLYSTTKFIEGHNATVGGAIVTRDRSVLDRLRLIRKSLGTIQSPFEAWLTLRGIKTLPLRLREQSRSAGTLARYLEAHPAVARVHYPGLASFAQADLSARQHGAEVGGKPLHGAILAFEVKGGIEGARRLLSGVRLITVAENCGAVESLLTHSATMTHADVPRDQREAAGIVDGLVRLSVGLEDVNDLINDLDGALEAVWRRERGDGSARSGALAGVAHA